MPRPLVVNSHISIPGEEISLTFARSSGPGGQNVNKVNSKVLLRWQVADTASLPVEVRARFLEKFASRINQEGELLLSSDRHRDQGRNIGDCYTRLRDLILSVAQPPLKRRKTRPSRASIERRLGSKRIKSQRKSERRQQPGVDE